VAGAERLPVATGRLGEEFSDDPQQAFPDNGHMKPEQLDQLVHISIGDSAGDDG
jgi:hypothetical protein